MWLASVTICSPLCLDGIGTVLSEKREKGWKVAILLLVFSRFLENRVRGSDTHKKWERQVTPLKLFSPLLWIRLAEPNLSTLTVFKGGFFLSCLFMDVIMWRVSQKVIFNSKSVFLCDWASVFCYQNTESSYVSKPPGLGFVQVLRLFGLVVLTDSFMFSAVDNT